MTGLAEGLGWAGAVASFGLAAAGAGFCLGAAREVPVAVPASVLTARVDQTPLVARDPAAAPSKAVSGRAYRIDLGYRSGMLPPDRAAVEPFGLEVDGDLASGRWWLPRTREYFLVRGHLPLVATGRVSGDVEPIDLRFLNTRAWGQAAENFPAIVGLAQQFNSGDLVEVAYDDGSLRRAWVPARALRDPSRAAPEPPAPRSSIAGRRRR